MLQSLAWIVIVTSAMPAGGSQSGAGTFLFLPAAGSISVAPTQQFTAIGTSSDNSTANITNSVLWTSSTTSVATMSNTGLAVGNGVGGPITITAQDPSTGVTGTVPLSVTSAVLASIMVFPNVSSLVAGESRQLSAMELYTDNSHGTLHT